MAGRITATMIELSCGRSPIIAPSRTNFWWPMASSLETSPRTMSAHTARATRRRAKIIATGGNTSNVHFRRMFDPRLTDVYQTAGEPYTFQDASGELAAMAIGASLWGLGNQMLENGATIRTQRPIGTRYNYFVWDVNSPIF